MAKISELLQDIEKFGIVLPEFQREYVWEKEQAKQLMVSLYKDYPTGSLLVWRTDDPPDIKHDAVPRDKIGTVDVLLDGQQRLTTLYMLMRGEIPPYYKDVDITHDPRDLYFNLQTEEFQYYQASRMRKDPTWVPVVDCFADDAVDPIAIATAVTEDAAAMNAMATRCYKNLGRLKSILGSDYPVQIVPDSATVDEAIDVFDRVNSLGTKLTDAELALAHMCGKWAHARRVLKEKIAQLARKRFGFDLNFMVRCLTGIVRSRAIFDQIHDATAEELQAGWAKLSKTLDYLVAILPAHAYVHSVEDLNTASVLVPVVVFLARGTGQFASQAEMDRFIHWLYAAHTWSRYTSQTDARLDHDIGVVLRSANPCAELLDAIIDQRGRLEIQPSDLDGRWVQHPFHKMAYITAKARGAVDWFNGVPLGTVQEGSYSFHSHHIFPTSLLYDEGGLISGNHMDSKMVNEIANRAYLTANSNITLSNECPSVYLREIEERYPGALEKQFIPMDEALWELENYPEFLAARRVLMAKAINEYMESLITECLGAEEITLESLLAAGESQSVEYKSTMRWDLRQEQVNKALEKVILKSIVGLMNAEGGHLLIGVSDDAEVLGIEDDLRSMGNQGDADGYQQRIIQMLSDEAGAQFGKHLQVSFEQRDGCTVCWCRVRPSPQPVYVKDGGQKQFFVRVGNTTRPFDAQEAHDYIGMHWEM